jgi:prepilin-type N-terminal cleavage/methylation domain-containing protein
MIRNDSLSPRQVGFTLVELLTVIAIIAVLAAITLGLTAAAKNARVNSRARTELTQIQTSIEAYKADRNAFPPDHRLTTGPARVDPAVNPLYYELIGTDVANGRFRPRGADTSVPGLTPDQVEQTFGRRGFLNASADPAEPTRGYLEPKASSVWRGTINGGAEVQLLITPFPWEARWPEPAPVPGASPSTGNSKNPNPWRYVSTSPTNNVGGFDLWTEIYVGKDKRVFKNW